MVRPNSAGKAALANRKLVVLSSVGNYRNRDVFQSVPIRPASSKPLPSRGKGSLIKNLWRWIKYYWRRKKIYLRDGTVLMPSIRLYDWLDFAGAAQDAGRRLP
jgi:hypothetical protein